MKSPKHWKDIIYYVLFSVFLVVFVIFSHSFFVNYKQLKKAGSFQYANHLLPQRGQTQSTSTQAVPLKADSIGEWMTFSYINQIFNLSPDYLSTALTIQDTRYPHLTISQYEKAKNLNDTDFLKQVQGSVGQYLQGAR